MKNDGNCYTVFSLHSTSLDWALGACVPYDAANYFFSSRKRYCALKAGCSLRESHPRRTLYAPSPNASAEARKITLGVDWSRRGRNFSHRWIASLDSVCRTAEYAAQSSLDSSISKRRSWVRGEIVRTGSA